MWLLGTSTLKLHNFVTDVPDYVILSHTWGAQEVSFDDIKNSQSRRKLNGFDKIVGCCQQARQDGFDWVWIDTCCIDKRSSAELSEAINSMYNWYWQAAKCYAYLSDVPDLREFKDSIWFERGWTLQELLAPAVVEFYDCEWGFIGTKLGLVNDIVQATGINRRYILQRHTIQDASVATKFSWASNRSTTRTEDVAYCLLGLMRVNMPMLYGEGHRAFFRLQLELLKNSNEHTIFAWGATGDRHLPQEASRVRSVLAPSPAWFRDSAGVVATGLGYTPHEVTSQGLRMKLPITASGGNVIVAWLRCRDEHGNTMGIRLDQCLGDEERYRTSANMLVDDRKTSSGPKPLMEMYLRLIDRDWVQDHSRYSRPAALCVRQIHTYHGSDVQLVSVSNDEEVATTSDLIDTSVTSIIDANYIVNELVVLGNRVACLSLLSSSLSKRETLIVLGLCGLEPMIFAIDRLEHMNRDLNWYTALSRHDHIRDYLVFGHEDFRHIISAKVVKEGTRLIWSVSIKAAQDTDRNCFYGHFGSLRGRHQENNLACFCVDCRVQRLRSSMEKASRWQAKVEIRQEMLASAQRQQKKQRSDTGVGHVLECTCPACAMESLIEVSTHVGVSEPHTSAQASLRDPPFEMRLFQSGDGQSSHGAGGVELRSSPYGTSVLSRSL